MVKHTLKEPPRDLVSWGLFYEIYQNRMFKKSRSEDQGPIDTEFKD